MRQTQEVVLQRDQRGGHSVNQHKQNGDILIWALLSWDYTSTTHWYELPNNQLTVCKTGLKLEVERLRVERHRNKYLLNSALSAHLQTCQHLVTQPYSSLPHSSKILSFNSSRWATIHSTLYVLEKEAWCYLSSWSSSSPSAKQLGQPPWPIHSASFVELFRCNQTARLIEDWLTDKCPFFRGGKYLGHSVNRGEMHILVVIHVQDQNRPKMQIFTSQQLCKSPAT